jgi:hypothetical protein
VTSDKPFHSATLPLAKPVPVIVTVTDGLPAGAEDGLTEVIAGAVVEAAMAIEKLCADDTLPAGSVAVTLKLNGLPVAVVGVPPITPVDAFSVSPGGKEPEETAQVYGGPMPPVAVRVCAA